ncbi:pyridoxamine 5'-phosphate oxidase family protein [Streptomyces sp. V4-01]|uniref:Pyridoxamine 5'-phosphate oxidase family protein n=1 Tax=Actinacidiphila polyblastidii TaxID=3110430 RepID=A0ABU7PLA7_9ACTN|nr:pyridoxamine 5'-phosphate oxidase family protein [Streptomyces sp. V4-01]
MRTDGTGFHDGELAVQQRAGVRLQAARLTGMLAAPALTGGARQFLAGRELAALTARDAAGLLWTVPLSGPAGFLDVVDDATLDVLALPASDGPLGGGPERGGQVGLIAVDFARRRRFRVNGTVAATGPTGFCVAAEQAYGNCPQYIQRREVLPGRGSAARAAERHDTLDEADAGLIRAADTFFLGTEHPTRGADASHRGGEPGFVRVADGRVWWPDYPGNNMFNSLGNIAADGSAALLFPDFGTGTALQLSGEAVVEWTEPGAPGDDGGTGRRVGFTPRRVVRTVMPVRGAGTIRYPHNPPVTRHPAA